MLTPWKTTEILRQIFNTFLQNPTGRFYVRQLERIIKKPVGSIQRHLVRLVDEDFLNTTTEGPLKYYALNPNYPYLSELQSVFFREQRKKDLEKNLKHFLTQLKKHYQPDKIILFGSFANNRVSPDSDIDLVIIKNEVPERYWSRIKEIAPLLKGCDVGMDVLIWTNEEWNRELQNDNLFLKEEILKKGKVLYDKARPEPSRRAA